jgi:hypothetical protein
MKTENRGGARIGAGRKLKGKMPRDKTIYVRTTEQERLQLKLNAIKNNQAMTDYILSRCL